MPYYGDASPYYYGGPFSNHSSLMTGIGRTIHSPLGSSRYAPHLSTISESPLSALRRYSPAATITSRPKRVIDTADIDVSTPRALSNSNDNRQRNRLRRDRPTIRIRSQALKDNPALREHYERHEKTVGELLVEKFLIKDKKQDCDGEQRTKLYAQVSLDSPGTKKQRDDLHEAIHKRVTRRMTRRRSSADVQMDPEQLEREVLIAQAQADALDSLVAEEQAEIEVETRMGTLIRKNLVRATPSVLGKHENQSGVNDDNDDNDDDNDDDDDNDNDDNDDAKIKKTAKKTKKRKKTTDKPSPPMNDVNLSGSAATNGDESIDDVDRSMSNKASKFKIEASNSVGDFSTLWINAGAREDLEKQRKNSSTVVEQFRDSVRLPAPRPVGKTAFGKVPEKDVVIVEEHQQVVVLPVKKRYVKDDSRNSVYLTLKTQNNGEDAKHDEETVDNVDDDDDDERSLSRLIGNGRRLERRLSNGSKPRSEKVAKFRSKDNAESDAEVRSISVPTERDAEGPGERWTKDGGTGLIDEPSTTSIVSVDAEGIAKKSNTVHSEKLNDNRVAIDYVDHGISRGKKNVGSNEIFDTTNFRKVVENNGEVGKESIVGGKNNKKFTENSNDRDNERTKKIRKISAVKFSARSDIIKSEEKEKWSAGEDDVTRICRVVESLPNAPTINSLDVANLGEDQALNSRGKSSNGSSDANAKNVSANGDTTGFEENSKKIAEAEITGEPSIIVVTKIAEEVNGLENSRKPKSNKKLQVEQRKVESPAKISTPNRKDFLFFKFENDKKFVEKNVTDFSKLPIERDVSEKSSKFDKDDDDDDEVPPKSPNLKIVSESPTKTNRQLKKRGIATTNGDKKARSLSKTTESIEDGEKNLSKVISIEKYEKENSTPIETKIEESSNRSKNEISKLTNGTAEKLKLKPIEEVRENRERAKAAGSKLKIRNKPNTPPISENEGPDFWSEIESQRIEKPAVKPKSEIIGGKTETNVDGRSIVGNNAIVLKSEAKPNTSTAESETAIARKGAETIVGGSVESEKSRRKKITETGACEKKYREKESAETISERVISGGDAGGDEKSRLVESQPQTSEESCLEKETTTTTTSEAKSCETRETDNWFDRNLSTIAEETSPGVSDDTAGNITADLLSLILTDQQKFNVKTVELTTNSDPSKTASIVASTVASIVASDHTDPGETTSPLNKSVERKSASSTNFEISVPTINIVEAPPPVTPPDIREDARPIVTAVEDGDRECEPETAPTVRSNDQVPKNIISKWNGRSDLSLDDADNDSKPETIDAGAKKKKSTKKVSVKKGSKDSVGSNSPTSPGTSPDSSRKKKVSKRKKSTTKGIAKNAEKRTIFEERSESKQSNCSDTTLKPGVGPNFRNSPINNNGSPRNTPKQRPLDLIKMFYTTPASLLTATPRDLSKVRRAKIKKKKHSTRTASASSDSTGSTRSTRSTETAESTGSNNERDDDAEQKRVSSTRSNDSGFDGSPRLSNCDMACHKKCEKLTGNLCGLNQKLVADALQAVKRAPSQSDSQRNSDGSDNHHGSGRITPPATNLPRFKKYTVMDFNFLKVLGKGSFGKVLLAELRRTDCVYAVKCLKKDVVLEDDDVECTLIERKVLTLATRHPYLCHLFCTFQTDSHLFFVMEYLNGGDLMFHIQKSGRFAESRARFYAAEIWSGLNFLHKKGIVYRDLKLDNVLLDFEGHIRIADFGMCKLQIFLDRTADTFCGTPDYMAPEIIKGLKYNQAVDWWSFGVLMYEMLTGQSPFSGCDEDELFWSICNERPFIPRYLSQEAMDVLVCLLEKDAGKRPLAHDIAVHPFFHSTQWDRLERRQLQPPFKPALEHTLDTRYFDTAFTAERPRLTPVPEQILTSMDQGVFRGFSYTNPNATD